MSTLSLAILDLTQMSKLQVVQELNNLWVVNATTDTSVDNIDVIAKLVTNTKDVYVPAIYEDVEDGFELHAGVWDLGKLNSFLEAA